MCSDGMAAQRFALFLWSHMMFFDGCSEHTFQNKCLQEAIVALCSGSLQFRACAFFSARCANCEKSGLSGSAAEARNFFAVRTFLAMSSCCIYVVDRSDIQYWILGRSDGFVLGTLLWDDVLGHAYMVCSSDASRSLGDSSDAPWLRCAVGGPKKNRNSKRGWHWTKAAKAERAGAVLSKRQTSDVVSFDSERDMSAVPHKRSVDEPEGVLHQHRSDLDSGALRDMFDDGDCKPLDDDIDEVHLRQTVVPAQDADFDPPMQLLDGIGIFDLEIACSPAVHFSVIIFKVWCVRDHLKSVAVLEDPAQLKQVCV